MPNDIYQKAAKQIAQIKADFFVALNKLKQQRRQEVAQSKQTASQQEMADLRNKINNL